MIRLLVIKPSSLGDIIHGLQVIESIKQQISDLHVTWIANDTFKDFVASCSTVDVVIPFYRNGGVRAFTKLLWSLNRGTHYDFVFDLQGLLRSALMLKSARGNLKVGRQDAREGARLFYKHRVKLPIHTPAHAIDILLQFLPFIGLGATLKGHLQFCSKITGNTPIIPDNTIVLFPNSRRPEKEWPYFSELTEALLHNLPHMAVVWVGQTAPKINMNWPKDRFYNLIGKTSLLDLPLIIQKAAIVVANDSGPMHLAAAIGKPLLALFGPTNPVQYGPYSLNSPLNNIAISNNDRLNDLSPNVVLDHLLKISK